MKQSSSGRVFVLAAVLLAVGGGMYVIYNYAPGRSPIYPPCLFYNFTGLHCPGCGTARGLHRLVHGDIPGAFAMNAFTMIALPFLAYSGAAELLRNLYGRQVLPAIKLPGRAGWAIFIAVMLFWILRNVPLYPFTLLAPH